MEITRSISVCLVAVLLSASWCNCQANFTMIYAIQKEIFVKEPGRYNVSRKLTNLNGNVTDFAIHNNHFYVSIKRSVEHRRNSQILRFKITNSKNFGIDNSGVKIFATVNAVFADILSMVIVGSYIYSGRSDGVMWRCLADAAHRCEDFNVLKARSVDTSIVNLDQFGGRMYAVQSVRNSTGCDRKLSYILKSCSLDTAKSCNTLYRLDDVGIKTFKVSFNAIWIGTEAGELLKCFEDKYCLEWNDFDQSGSMSIGVLDQYLYVHVGTGKYVWHCDRNKKNSCTKVIKVSDAKNMGPFTIV